MERQQPAHLSTGLSKGSKKSKRSHPPKKRGNIESPFGEMSMQTLTTAEPTADVVQLDQDRTATSAVQQITSAKKSRRSTKSSSEAEQYQPSASLESETSATAPVPPQLTPAKQETEVAGTALKVR
ncbi:uncharacterized protein LOC142768474 [Rhipicephalus microplus]|uniref:uncharacterized protein LOC142768474 n=1 Tax=Rhipicephalus microplus TaxID=6941 RepID=UPI003F6B3A60